MVSAAPTPGMAQDRRVSGISVVSGGEPAPLPGQYGAFEPVPASVRGGNAGDDAAG